MGDDKYECKLEKKSTVIVVRVSEAQLETIRAREGQGEVLGIKSQPSSHYPAMISHKRGTAQHLGKVLYPLGEKAR